MSSTERTQVRRHSERARTDRQELYAVLDEGRVCHVGVVVDGHPLVMPTGYGRLGDTLYLHGSSANRSMQAAADGIGVCVTVTLLDGLVLARSVFNHSMNYRSAVIFGAARQIEEPAEKLAALRVVTEHLAPGQWEAVRQPTRKELAATMALALPLDEASVKVRSGPPRDGDTPDAELPVWAGVLPIRQVIDEPIPAPDVPDDVDIPEHIRRLVH
ncbi:MAG: pyridoxamine 5'-phosphate oxidase family protein [Streptosporangiales bacterium]|nr:pyridoxamine 5'-phosphate oxidase family protein [Streptosporangiales bacterium]